MDGEEEFFTKMSCPNGHISLMKLSRELFLFNSPFGMCEDCNGLGNHKIVDPDLVIPDKNKSWIEGAIELLIMLRQERTDIIIKFFTKL